MEQQCCSPPTSPSCPSRCPTGWSSWAAAASRRKRRVAGARRSVPSPRRNHRKGATPWGRGMWRDALLVAGKDLRIEARARVALWQVVPFAVLVLVLLAFAIGPDQSSLRHAAPGIFWVALLFSTVLAIQRSVAIESGEGTRDGLRLSGIDPAGIFLGKAAAVALQLLLLQLVLWAGVTFLFDVRVHTVWLAVVACLLATVGLACAGVLYGALSAGLRVRDTLLPLLVLPVLAPVLLAGSKIWQAALSGNASSGTQWLKILVPFAVIYFVVGIVLYGPLQEAA